MANKLSPVAPTTSVTDDYQSVSSRQIDNGWVTSVSKDGEYRETYSAEKPMLSVGEKTGPKMPSSLSKAVKTLGGT